MNESDLRTLVEFLECPVSETEVVLEKFAALPGAVRGGSGNEAFVYVPGSREDRVVLVAHADTVSCGHHRGRPDSPVEERNGVVRRAGWREVLGADDRAGCAILWLLRDSGHSLLVTTGEEVGARGASLLMRSYPELARELNHSHRFMVELDRRNAGDLKRYYAGTEEFLAYVESCMKGFRRALRADGSEDRGSSTDITVLCRDVCGVNISVGYHKEHTAGEYLVLAQWQNTLDRVREWLATPCLPRFPLVGASR